MQHRLTHSAWIAVAVVAVLVAAACQPVTPPTSTTTTSTTTSTVETTTTSEPCTPPESSSTTSVDETTSTTEEPTTTQEPTTTEETSTTIGGDTTSSTEPCIPPDSTSSTTSTTAGPALQPDVLWVMLDDESIDTTPYYMPRTFQRLAGPHWYRFTQAVVPTPLCGPVRSTLLTGLTVDHHGMSCNQGNAELCKRWGTFRPLTVPKAEANAGVWVGWYGKRTNWEHECGKVDSAKQGFPNLPGVVDDHVHYIDTAEMFTQYQLVENGVANSYDSTTQGAASYGTYKTADLAMAGIQNCVSPCAIHWMPQAPHDPGTPAPDYDPSKVLPGVTDFQPPYNEGCPGAVDPDISDKPSMTQSAKCVSKSIWKRTRTAASLQAVDNRLPEMIDAFLAKSPERPKRIIFTSDHGRELGNHRHTGKEVPWEMSVRVPLYIYDSDQPGGVVDTLVNTRDLPATVLDWQWATPLAQQDGRSLVPLYTHTATDWYTDTYISHLQVSGTLTDTRPWRSVRQDCTVAAAENRHCLKVVLYPATSVEVKKNVFVDYPDEWEVYALDQDPWELTNLVPNTFTGYAGVPGWDDANPEVAAVKASLAVHMARGR